LSTFFLDSNITFEKTPNMKKVISTLCLLSLVFCGCKKETNNSLLTNVTKNYADSAIQFLNQSMSAADFAKVNLTNYKALTCQNKNIGIRFFINDSSASKYLLLYGNDGKFSGNWINTSGLYKTSARYSSGFVVLDNLDKSITTKFIVVSNSVTQVVTTDNKNLESTVKAISKTRGNSFGGPSTAQTASPMLPDIIIVYDVDQQADDLESLYWFSNQGGGYADYYYGTGDSGGGGGDGSNGVFSNNTYVAPMVIAPVSPVDLKKELECFTNNNTATYDIAINVNQPDPGTRDIANPFSSSPVGHTFLTLQQYNADGTSIIRNVGFYPKYGVKPGSAIAASIFGDDSNTFYDASLNFSVTGAELSVLISTLYTQQDLDYDLDNFNCTNAAISALQAIEINLPSTKSTTQLFKGNDPGDLGEDIRGLNLDKFTTANGNRKIIRTLSNSNNRTPAARKGGC
jgi:hypothetical protein